MDDKIRSEHPHHHRIPVNHNVLPILTAGLRSLFKVMSSWIMHDGLTKAKSQFFFGQDMDQSARRNSQSPRIFYHLFWADTASEAAEAVKKKRGGEKTNITSIWVMKRHHLCQILTVEETTEAKGKLGNALGRPRSGLHSKRRIESGLEGWWGCLLELADPSRYIFQVETQTSNYRTFKISLNASSTMDSVLAASI